MKVYITDFNILRENYNQPGIIYFKKGIYDEDFKNEFISDKIRRYKRWVPKSILLAKIIEDFSNDIGLEPVPIYFSFVY